MTHSATRLATILLAALPVTGGCLDRDDGEHYARTPDGFRVKGRGTWHGNVPQSYIDFDTAVKRAALELEQTEGIAQANVIAWAHTCVYELHDRIFFATQAGLATGAYWPRSQPEIYLAYWPYGTAPDEATAQALASEPWTVYQGTTTGTWYYGIEDRVNMYPALAHELAHGFGIHNHKAGGFRD